CATDGYLDYW
nr:immunoglobulin heavy chain junction region [Mus musculus]